MAKIEFLGPISKDEMDVDIKNLRQLKDILSKEEELSSWLEICSVALNGCIVDSLDVAVKKDDVISLLPPVCGG